MEKYPLFDKRSGILVRNYYCLECMCGPFTKEDVNRNLLISMGGERHEFLYCRKCCSSKFQDFFGRRVNELSEEEKEREKYILSGEALNDLKDNAKQKFILKNKKDSDITKEVPPILPKVKSEIIPAENLIEEIIKESEATLLEQESKENLEKEINITSKDLKENAIEKINFSDMSAKDIVNLVEERIGEKITLSLKSKKSIIEKAKKILYGQLVDNKPKKPAVKKVIVKNLELKISHGNNGFSNMSAREIINLVKEKTGQDITISIKSKSTIIKHAQRIFAENNITL